MDCQDTPPLWRCTAVRWSTRPFLGKQFGGPTRGRGGGTPSAVEDVGGVASYVCHLSLVRTGADSWPWAAEFDECKEKLMGVSLIEVEAWLCEEGLEPAGLDAEEEEIQVDAVPTVVRTELEASATSGTPISPAIDHSSGGTTSPIVRIKTHTEKRQINTVNTSSPLDRNASFVDLTADSSPSSPSLLAPHPYPPRIPLKSERSDRWAPSPPQHTYFPLLHLSQLPHGFDTKSDVEIATSRAGTICRIDTRGGEAFVEFSRPEPRAARERAVMEVMNQGWSGCWRHVKSRMVWNEREFEDAWGQGGTRSDWRVRNVEDWHEGGARRRSESTSLSPTIPRIPLPREDAPYARRRISIEDVLDSFPPILRIKFNNLALQTTEGDIVHLLNNEVGIPSSSFRNIIVHKLLVRAGIAFAFVDLTCFADAQKLLSFYRGASRCSLSANNGSHFKVALVPSPRIILSSLPPTFAYKATRLQVHIRKILSGISVFVGPGTVQGEFYVVVDTITEEGRRTLERYLGEDHEAMRGVTWDRMPALCSTMDHRQETGSNPIGVLAGGEKRESEEAGLGFLTEWPVKVKKRRVEDMVATDPRLRPA